MNRFRCKFLLPLYVIVIALGIAETTVAQEPIDASISVLLETSEPQPATPFKVVIDATWPAALTGEILNFRNRLTGITVLGEQKDLSKEGRFWRERRVLRLQVPGKGLYVFPPVTLVVSDHAGRTLLRRSSNPLYLEIPPGEGADPGQLRPIKPLQEMPYEFSPWWLLLLALPLVGLLVWLLMRRRTEAGVVIDPWREVREGLKEIARLQPSQEPIERTTAFEMSYVVRRLIEQATELPALEYTGEELSRKLARARLPYGGSLWRELAEQSAGLETVKFQPGQRGSESVDDWLARVRQLVSQLETARQQYLAQRDLRKDEQDDA